VIDNRPHCFAADQLQDLEGDPDEQINLAADQAYAGAPRQTPGGL
jgi:hypothetical protein